jgi:HPt (histidine-containing phosphotransfer) domain-containing protein
MPDDPIDAATLGELLDTVGGDEAFLAELVGSYLADSPGLFDEMDAAIAGGDAVTLRRAAHTLKSTSVSLGALRLSEMCREIEQAAIGGELLAARVAGAAAEYERVHDALAARAAGAAPA